MINDYYVYYTIRESPEIYSSYIQSCSPFGAWNKFKKRLYRTTTQCIIKYVGVQKINRRKL